MRSFQRQVGLLILLTLVLSPITIFAQADSLTIVGSGIPAPLAQDYADAAGTPVDLSVTGTNAGFAALCGGSASATLATRAITAEEESACGESGVSFLEFLLGYDIMTVIANDASGFGVCLSSSDLDALFAPSSTLTNWNEVNVANPDIMFSLYVPPENTTPFALLDSLVEGFGLRNDVTTEADSAAVVAAVLADENGIGVTTLAAAQAAESPVRILNLNTTSAGCAAPSVESVSGRTYEGAYPLYLYANAAEIDALQPLLDATFSDDSAASVSEAGFISPNEAELEANRQIAADVTTGRQFSKSVTDFDVPANLVGAIAIAGSAAGADFLENVTGSFVQQFPGVTIVQNNLGETDGARRLCNAEVDMITAFADLTPEQAENCAANNVTVETIEIGSQAVVILGNGDFLQCLPVRKIAALWSAAAEASAITNWNQVDESYPNLPITLVAPPLGDRYGDLLMLLASGGNIPIRIDVAESKSDPAYRATAVGNVEGALTYMSWGEYANLSATTQGSAEPVAIDAGNGCVTPSPETIRDGSYALARPLKLLINQRALAREEVQSLLWVIASDANYSALQSLGYVGIEFSTLPDLRDHLQQLYAQAEEDALQPEATPEPTAEVTAESTQES